MLQNIAYKIYAKVLQKQLQKPLASFINTKQSAFLKNQSIHDNILLIHEMLAWAKISKQKSIFVKLDFSKAYYLVDWCFLFNVICKMGFSTPFVNIKAQIPGSGSGNQPQWSKNHQLPNTMGDTIGLSCPTVHVSPRWQGPQCLYLSPPSSRQHKRRQTSWH